MAKWVALYSNGNGEPKQLVIDDTTNSTMPTGVNDVLQQHGDDFNDGGSVFVVLTADKFLDVVDAQGTEVPRTQVSL